jgi:splicing factor 3B subunit 3
VLSAATLDSKDAKNLVCFGCCSGHSNFPQPNSRFPSIRIYSYEFNEGELLVSHLFNFPLEAPPSAMDIYFSKLLVGVGTKLVLFDIYKQKLVLRATSDTLSSPINTINVHGQKIFLTQVTESFSLMRINHKTKCFELVGQDTLDRFTTCACLMDGEGGVMAGGDKFGNFFVSKSTESKHGVMQK